MSLEKIVGAAKSVAKYAVGCDIHPYWNKMRNFHSDILPEESVSKKIHKFAEYPAEVGSYVFRFVCLLNEAALAYSYTRHPEFVQPLMISELILRGIDVTGYLRNKQYEEFIDWHYDFQSSLRENQKRLDGITGKKNYIPEDIKPATSP